MKGKRIASEVSQTPSCGSGTTSIIEEGRIETGSRENYRLWEWSLITKKFNSGKDCGSYTRGTSSYRDIGTMIETKVEPRHRRIRSRRQKLTNYWPHNGRASWGVDLRWHGSSSLTMAFIFVRLFIFCSAGFTSLIIFFSREKIKTVITYSILCV